MSKQVLEIVLKGVSYSYPDSGASPVYALSSLTLEVKAGDFLCILGPNGSGKSTLGRLFNALLLPTEGSVQVDGMDTRNAAFLWKIRTRVGMVFQNPDNQIVGTIVEEDIAFGLENLGIPPNEIRARVDWAMEKVGISNYAKHPPNLLSGGQKQRVAIAGVLAMKPSYIVLDEPTSLLDPKGREEALRTIQELHKEGITLILITHRMEEAMSASRLLVLEKGKLAFLGTPAQLVEELPAGGCQAAGGWNDELRRHAHLDLPPAIRLAQLLREGGIPLPPFLPRPEDLVRTLCALKRSA
ncbi:MAG: energy-coupling factor transporter ATPase [Coprothermobacterota bacterium]|nr:energy-coupling factor transporter ATPase [Coprothermobacterota bacterium]